MDVRLAFEVQDVPSETLAIFKEDRRITTSPGVMEVPRRIRTSSPPWSGVLKTHDFSC